MIGEARREREKKEDERLDGNSSHVLFASKEGDPEKTTKEHSTLN